MSVTGQQIVDYALQWVGYPYIKGGQGAKLTASYLAWLRDRYGEEPYTGADKHIGTEVFDCSGLVTNTLITLGVTASKQSHNAAWYQAHELKIGKADIQPGDLCFKCRDGSAHHVGICIGNNKVVEAKGRKWGVIVSTGASSWDCFRRINGVIIGATPDEPIPPDEPQTDPGDGEPPEFYTVVKGDSLSRIARRYDLEWPDIAALNGILPPWVIRPGQRLRLYPEPVYYTVKRGDCLSAIGKALGKNWRKIAADNNIDPPYVIRTGQRLLIK